MALTIFVIFWILLKSTSCLFQCIPETLDDSEFYINVTEHITEQSTNCIRIPYEVTFPRDKVTVPYKKILFKGDPSNVIDTKIVNDMSNFAKDIFSITSLPPGEHKYGVKLEWGCNQTYVFPKWIHISALTTKPTVLSSLMVERQHTRLTCLASRPCSGKVFLSWKWTDADGQSTMMDSDLDDYDYIRWHVRFGSSHRDRPGLRHRGKSNLQVIPTADHHNANITCIATYDHDVAETTITLSVKFSPRILNSSYCTVKGELLLCVCISWGNPPPPIFWPSETLTDYAVTSFSNAERVNSTLAMPAAKYHNDTVKCMSRNEVGQAESELQIQNSTEHDRVNSSPESALPWLTGVCFTLNLVFIALFICIYLRNRKQQKESREEADTYATLRKADMDEAYSTISPQNR